MRFRPGSIIPASARSTAIGKTPAGCSYTSCRDDEALAAFHTLARSEGILPALESSHAVAKAIEAGRPALPEDVIVVCLSGRGDKDAAEIARLRGESPG